jgi:glycosyltransferase involved in cell wall biosynthesis
MERALAAQGVTVETATTDDDGPGRRSGKAGQGAVVEEGTVRRYFAKRSDFYKWSPGFARWIARAVTDYDLLHLHALFSFTTTAASQAARRAGVPYVVRPLGTLAPWGMEHRRPWLKRASLRMIEKPLLRHAAAVHFTSDEEMREASALRIDMRPVVIPLGIDMPPPAVRTPPSDGSVRALFLSRLHPKKNLDGLLDAVAMLREEFPHLRLAIAGSGDTEYASALRAHADALGLSGRVTWLGFVEGEAKLRAFVDADFFVLPSHSENFGIAAAEALAHGLPCVLSSGVAIAREVVAAGAGIEIATSAESIAAGLRLIMPAAARAPMQASALRVARERYSLDAMGARLKHLYLDISGSRRGLPAKR